MKRSTAKQTPLEVHLANYAIGMVRAMGQTWGRDCVARNLTRWEREYGSDVASKARKLILADWQKRFGKRARNGGPASRLRPDAEGVGPPADEPSDEADAATDA